jgi:hypothetical protein
MLKNIVVNILIYLGCRNDTDVTVNVILQEPTLAPTIQAATPSPSEYVCTIPDKADILWLIDGSTSMIPNVLEYETTNDWFVVGQELVRSFTDQVTMDASVGWRQSFLFFAGEYWNPNENSYIDFTTVIDTQPLTDNGTLFKQKVSAIFPPGGSTNLSGIVDIARAFYINNQTARSPPVPTYVVLITDGEPSDRYGFISDQVAQDARESIQKLKEEDHIKFVYVRLGTEGYQTEWLQGMDDQRFLLGSTADAELLLSSGTFLCF